jgi:hypothetical protein
MAEESEPTAAQSKTPSIGRLVVAALLTVLAISGLAWALVRSMGAAEESSTPDAQTATTTPNTAEATAATSLPEDPHDDRTSTDEGRTSTWYASPDGADDGSGTEEDPIGNLEEAFERLRPGDTLIVRGGVFTENVNPSIRSGSADAPITVAAYPGERPIVQGLLWLREPSYWTIKGINVTWDDDNSRREHMVKITGGERWHFTDAEVWGARSYAAILVAGEPTDFLLSRLFVHDTYRSNDDNQDHLIYLNSGTGGGVVEHNLLVRSENGRGIKIGGTSRDSEVDNIVIRFNTFYGNLGPSNIQLSYGASNNRIERNVFVQPGGDGFAVTAFRLSGTNNLVLNNIAWEATDVVQPDVDGLVDDGGNILIDPDFRDPTEDDFTPLTPDARDYGHLATGG